MPGFGREEQKSVFINFHENRSNLWYQYYIKRKQETLLFCGVALQETNVCFFFCSLFHLRGEIVI